MELVGGGECAGADRLPTRCRSGMATLRSGMSPLRSGMAPLLRRGGWVAGLLLLPVLSDAGTSVAPLGARALHAQEVGFPMEIREGREFHRRVQVTSRERSIRPGATGSVEVLEELVLEGSLRVARLNPDGSGILEAEPSSLRLRREGPDRPSQTWIAGEGPPPEGLEYEVYEGMLHRTFRVPFLPGGQVNPEFFAATPDDDRATLERWTLLLLVGPEDRVDGFPLGFPDALEAGTPRTGSVPEGFPVLRYSLEGVEEEEGRRVARIRFETPSVPPAMMGDAEDVSAETGFARVDVDANEVLELVRLRRRTLEAPAGEARWTLESRTTPAG